MINLNTLPFEIKEKIFINLDGYTFAQLQILSREFNNLYQTLINNIPNIWYTKCIKEIKQECFVEYMRDNVEQFIYSSSYHPLNSEGGSLSKVGELNLIWENFYATWYLQKRVGSWNRVKTAKIVKSAQDSTPLNAKTDIITRALFNGTYLITGHESGYICQWNLDSPQIPILITQHQSGAIRDMILFDEIPVQLIGQQNSQINCDWLKYTRIVSIAQDNVVKLTPLQPTDDQILQTQPTPISISHPRGAIGPPGSGSDKPFLTVLCTVAGRPEYICTGARSGFVSIWEHDLTTAFMRILFRAHDSEIIHMATCSRTLVTVSLTLDVKLWWLFPSSNESVQKFSLRCYHSLSLGFHSYQQSLPFGASTFYAAPWSNFVFKNDLILAANLKLVAALFVKAPSSDEPLAQDTDTLISYRQCRAASKLPYYCENDSINALTLKANLLCLATSSGWIIMYYINDPTQLLDEWEKGQPLWAHKLTPQDFTMETGCQTTPIITGIDLSVETTRPRIAITSNIGVVVFTFCSKLL